MYDWTLGISGPWNAISDEIEQRLRIERFCDNVSRSLYSNLSDVLGLVADANIAAVLTSLQIELQELDIITTFSRMFSLHEGLRAMSHG